GHLALLIGHSLIRVHPCASVVWNLSSAASMASIFPALAIERSVIAKRASASPSFSNSENTCSSLVRLWRSAASLSLSNKSGGNFQFAGAKLLQNALQHLRPFQARHADIHEDNVRPVGPNGIQRLVAILSRHDFAINAG